MSNIFIDEPKGSDPSIFKNTINGFMTSECKLDDTLEGVIIFPNFGVGYPACSGLLSDEVNKNIYIESNGMFKYRGVDDTTEVMNRDHFTPFAGFQANMIAVPIRINMNCGSSVKIDSLDLPWAVKVSPLNDTPAENRVKNSTSSTHSTAALLNISYQIVKESYSRVGVNNTIDLAATAASLLCIRNIELILNGNGYRKIQSAPPSTWVGSLDNRVEFSTVADMAFSKDDDYINILSNEEPFINPTILILDKLKNRFMYATLEDVGIVPSIIGKRNAPKIVNEHINYIIGNDPISNATISSIADISISSGLDPMIVRRMMDRTLIDNNVIFPTTLQSSISMYGLRFNESTYEFESVDLQCKLKTPIPPNLLNDDAISSATNILVPINRSYVLPSAEYSDDSTVMGVNDILNFSMFDIRDIDNPDLPGTIATHILPFMDIYDTIGEYNETSPESYILNTGGFSNLYYAYSIYENSIVSMINDFKSKESYFISKHILPNHPIPNDIKSRSVVVSTELYSKVSLSNHMDTYHIYHAPNLPNTPQGVTSYNVIEDSIYRTISNIPNDPSFSIKSIESTSIIPVKYPTGLKNNIDSSDLVADNGVNISPSTIVNNSPGSIQVMVDDDGQIDIMSILSTADVTNDTIGEYITRLIPIVSATLPKINTMIQECTIHVNPDGTDIIYPEIKDINLTNTTTEFSSGDTFSTIIENMISDLRGSSNTIPTIPALVRDITSMRPPTRGKSGNPLDTLKSRIDSYNTQLQYILEDILLYDDSNFTLYMRTGTSHGYITIPNTHQIINHGFWFYNIRKTYLLIKSLISLCMLIYKKIQESIILVSANLPYYMNGTDLESKSIDCPIYSFKNGSSKVYPIVDSDMVLSTDSSVTLNYIQDLFPKMSLKYKLELKLSPISTPPSAGGEVVFCGLGIPQSYGLFPDIYNDFWAIDNTDPDANYPISVMERLLLIQKDGEWVDRVDDEVELIGHVSLETITKEFSETQSKFSTKDFMTISNDNVNYIDTDGNISTKPIVELKQDIHNPEWVHDVRDKIQVLKSRMDNGTIIGYIDSSRIFPFLGNGIKTYRATFSAKIDFIVSEPRALKDDWNVTQSVSNLIRGKGKIFSNPTKVDEVILESTTNIISRIAKVEIVEAIINGAIDTIAIPIIGSVDPSMGTTQSDTPFLKYTLSALGFKEFDTDLPLNVEAIVDEMVDNKWHTNVPDGEYYNYYLSRRRASVLQYLLAESLREKGTIDVGEYKIQFGYSATTPPPGFIEEYKSNPIFKCAGFGSMLANNRIMDGHNKINMFSNHRTAIYSLNLYHTSDTHQSISYSMDNMEFTIPTDYAMENKDKYLKLPSSSIYRPNYDEANNLKSQYGGDGNISTYLNTRAKVHKPTALPHIISDDNIGKYNAEIESTLSPQLRTAVLGMISNASFFLTGGGIKSNEEAKVVYLYIYKKQP